MAKLAVIGTFYQRYEQSRACLEAVLSSTRVPDEIIIVCETQEDANNISKLGRRKRVQVHVLPTPKDDAGYTVIPYSHKINFALDNTDADYIVYLDNGSMPDVDKYRLMAQALDKNPDWFAVYCTQERTGYAPMVHVAQSVVNDPHSVINYTQAMHRKTDKRWTLDMQYAKPNDVADAMFFQSLGVPFYPVGEQILDTHHMESPMASGL